MLCYSKNNCIFHTCCYFQFPKSWSLTGLPFGLYMHFGELQFFSFSSSLYIKQSAHRPRWIPLYIYCELNEPILQEELFSLYLLYLLYFFTLNINMNTHWKGQTFPVSMFHFIYI
jgi:hypothetical protein